MNMNAYRRMLGKISSALLLAGAFVVVSAARADAALIVYICDQDDCGGAVTQIVDNGAGDTNPNVGRINASFAGGTIESLASSNNVGLLSSLSLNYDITEDSFNIIGTPYFFSTDDIYTNVGIANLEANASDGGGLADLFIGTGTFNVFAPGAPTTGCVMDCDNVLAPTGGTTPYFMAIRIAPTLGEAGARGDATVTVRGTVPDGGSTVLLLGSALCAFGMLRRRIGR
jgi:hypothetical protein